MDTDNRDFIIAAIRKAESAYRNDASAMVEMIRRSVPDASLTAVLEVLQRHAAAPSANLDDVHFERLIMTKASGAQKVTPFPPSLGIS
jgi:hypothetical protein